jgi:hypothetical protein
LYWTDPAVFGSPAESDPTSILTFLLLGCNGPRTRPVYCYSCQWPAGRSYTNLGMKRANSSISLSKGSPDSYCYNRPPPRPRPYRVVVAGSQRCSLRGGVDVAGVVLPGHCSDSGKWLNYSIHAFARFNPAVILTGTSRPAYCIKVRAVPVQYGQP